MVYNERHGKTFPGMGSRAMQGLQIYDVVLN